MGVFDSILIDCPKCGNELEFQSKSGRCAMFRYTRDDVPSEVAMGCEGDIVKCQFCDTNWEFSTTIPKVPLTILTPTTEEASYNGNYNPDHPISVKKTKELAKLFREKLGAEIDIDGKENKETK